VRPESIREREEPERDHRYTLGDRVLFELLQHAHDAHAVGEKDEVAIHLLVANDNTGFLLVTNEGCPFSDSNFEAIRNIGTSDKEIGEGIGNKGLNQRRVPIMTGPRLNLLVLRLVLQPLRHP
jgi:hypothetical protein